MTLIIDAINMCEAKTLEYKIETNKIQKLHISSLLLYLKYVLPLTRYILYA